LSESEKELLGQMSEYRHRQSERIIEQGTPGGKLYIIYAGKVSVELKDDKGSISHMGDVGEGNVLGEMSFLNEKAASADVIAKENTVVYVMPRDLFLRIMDKERNLTLEIIERILCSTSHVILNLNYKLLPFVKVISEKVKNIPLIIKLIPVIFTLLYIGGFIYISFKDFSY
jgi:CRP-like cAMP-binding protein